MKAKLIITIFLVNLQATVWAQSNADLSSILDTCRMIEEDGFDKDSLLYYATMAYQLSADFGNTKEAALAKMYYGAAHFRKDSSIFFSELNTSLRINASIKYYEGMALGQLLLARKLNDLGRYEEALEKFVLAEEAILKEKNITSQRKNLILCKIAYLRSSVYQSTGQYKKALEVGLKSVEYAQLSRDSMVLFKSYNNLSVTYGELSSPDKNLGTKEDQKRYEQLTLDYLTKAYGLSMKMNVPMQRAVSGFNLALLHCNKKEYKESIHLLHDVIPTTYRAKMPDLRYHAYDVISEIYLDTHQPDSAEYYIVKADQLADVLDAPYFKIDSKYNLGNLYLAKGSYSRATNFATSGLAMAEKEGRLKNQRFGHNLLYEIHKEQGDFKQALDHYIKFKSIEDSLLTESAANEIKALTEKHQAEIRENQILQLQGKSATQELQIKYRNYALFGLFLGGSLISLLIFYFFRNRALQERKKAILSKQKLLRTQLNPHFIFNALNSIQQFIYQEKDPQLTADYLAKFARLTRRILNYSKEDYILLKDELAFLEDYMDLQMIRFDDPFEYQITIDDEIEESEVLIPPMFTQPFIENSIEHGIWNKQERGKIEIKISKEGGHLVIQIEDNGVGREKAEFKKLNSDHRSLATKITLERLREMERLLKKRAKLAIEDIMSEDDLIVGTKVRLDIPMKHV
jgi:hypothetical protein